MELWIACARRAVPERRGDEARPLHELQAAGTQPTVRTYVFEIAESVSHGDLLRGLKLLPDRAPRHAEQHAHGAENVRSNPGTRVPWLTRSS